MAKYRKKPVVIEAFQWMQDEAPEWFRQKNGIMIQVDSGSAFIPTLEGTMEARPMDWIIKGVMGEVYPCKPDVFEATYEKAEP